MLLVIPGKPLAQKRHRFTRSAKGNIWSYDPQARDKVLIRQTIENGIENQYPQYECPEFPDILFRFYMPIPKSMSVKLKEEAYTEKMRHVSKPDVDNIIKFYLDVFKGRVLKDDCSVKLLSATKLYSRHPRVEAEITEGIQFEDAQGTSDYAFPDSVICDEPQNGPKDIPTFLESFHY